MHRSVPGGPGPRRFLEDRPHSALQLGGGRQGQAQSQPGLKFLLPHNCGKGGAQHRVGVQSRKSGLLPIHSFIHLFIHSRMSL